MKILYDLVQLVQVLLQLQQLMLVFVDPLLLLLVAKSTLRKRIIIIMDHLLVLMLVETDNVLRMHIMQTIIMHRRPMRMPMPMRRIMMNWAIITIAAFRLHITLLLVVNNKLEVELELGMQLMPR
jgi:hypothetical protein